MVFGFGHGIYQIHACLVQSQHIGRRKDTDIRGHDRSGIHPLAIARYRHVAHHIDIRDLLAEVIDDSLCGFGHAFHEFLFTDIPLVILSRCGVNPGLSDPPVRTADTDVLVASAETTLCMSFEMGKHHQGVVVGSMAAY